MCHSSLLRKEAEAQEMSRLRGDSTDKTGTDEDDVVASSDEEDVEETIEDHGPSRWLDTHMVSWATYVYLKPEHGGP